MEDTIQEQRKAMIENMELGQGCRRLQMWLMTGAKFQAVFPI
jgi:hypothetical protein